MDVVGTIGQFEELAKNKHIDGLEALLKTFFRAAEELAQAVRPARLPNNQFDRDYLDFNVSSMTSRQLAGFHRQVVREHHEHGGEPELLTQFQRIMHRDALKRDLDAVQHHLPQLGADLEAVMKTTRSTGDPPKSRNAPPVAGDILWARQLLRRIEPMHSCDNERS